MAARNSSFGFAPDRTAVPRSTTGGSGVPKLSSQPAALAMSTHSTLPRKVTPGQRIPLPAVGRAPGAEMRLEGSVSQRNPAESGAGEKEQLSASVERPPRESSLLYTRRTSGTATPLPLSASRSESPPKNVLRRKPSVIGSFIEQRRRRQTSKEDLKKLPSPEFMQGLGFVNEPQNSEKPAHDALRPSTATLQPSPALQPHPSDLRPFQTPTPLSNPSVTPSLIFTDSPGAPSHRTTPASYASYSPNLNDFAPGGVHIWQGLPETNTPEILAKPRKVDLPASRLTQLPASATSQQDVKRQAETTTKQKDRSTTEKKEIQRKQIRPPELAHLMIDSVASDAPEPPTAAVNQTLTKPATRTALPKLNTSIDRKPHASTSTKATTPVSGKRVPRKSVEAKSPSTLKKSPASALAAVAPDLAKTGLSRAEAAQKSSSRFGFFTRKKASASASSDDLPKLGRKGPTAGTGYEGFGKYAANKKSSSANGSTSSSAGPVSARPRSRDSVAQQNDEVASDEFLQRRLTPVYIRGDGATQSPQKRASDPPTEEEPSGTIFSSPKTAVSSQSSASLGTPWSMTNSAKPASASELNSADSIDARIFQEALLPRPRPKHELQLVRPSTAGPTLSVANANAAIDLQHDLPRRPSLDNYTAQSTSSSSEDNEAKIDQLLPPSKLVTSKGKSASMWNLFSRSKTNLGLPETDLEREFPPEPTVEQKWSNHSIALHSATQSSPHYVFFDSTSQVDFEDLQSIMEEADRVYWDFRPSRRKSSSTDGLSNSPVPSIPSTFRIEGSPIIPPVAPDQVYSNFQQLQSPIDVKPLPDPAKDDIEALDFARPPRLAQVGRIPQVVSKRDRQRQMPTQSFSRPFLDQQSRPHHRHESSEELQTENTKQTPNQGPAADVIQEVDELMPLPLCISAKGSPDKAFLALNQRKASVASFSSSSRTSFIHTASATAVLPTPGSPLSPDEVWDEYDDLVGELSKPGATTEGIPDVADSLAPAEPAQAGVSSKDATNNNCQEHCLLPATARTETSNAKAGVESALSSTMSLFPKVPRSGLKHRHDESKSTNASSDSDPLSPSRTRTSTSSDPASMANLRFGALMVSKWLSFGRVLVSPAHHEIESSLSDERILIIDGLVKDWSYYCALVYASAQVYSLGPSKSKSSNRNSLGGGLEKLPNHKHLHYADLSARLPFPKAFFSAVVIRFPTATTEAALRNLMSESKRVLRPGGYIEISTLDLDLRNMGSKTRREVRRLKQNIHSHNPNVSLRSASDNMQRLLGRKGFENLNRCLVGVPAAGVISESRDASRDEKNVGIMELMRDPTEQGDRDITKMVAKVGRWWYSRCYEQSVLPGGDSHASIWSDQEVLKECETQSTTFKLLICYAQKPTLAKRRAVSL